MSLRLVLVCLVAGLGIGIPSRPEIEGWVASSRRWTQPRPVVLSINQADDGDREITREFRRLGTDGPRMSRPWRIAPALLEATQPIWTTEPEAPVFAAAHPAPLSLPQTPAASPEATEITEITPPSFDPIEVDDRMYVGLAHDLNYFGEGLGMLREVAVPSAPRSSTIRPDELAELAITQLGADAVRLAVRLGRDLNAVAARELARESFLAMEESSDLYFDTLSEEPKAVEVDVVAVEPKPAEETAPSPFDAMERGQSLYFAESFATTPADIPAPAVAIATELPALPADPFAPADAVEDHPTALAEASTGPEPARPGDVKRAVRLTGQALTAWLNVFTKAPLVAASPTSASIR